MGLAGTADTMRWMRRPAIDYARRTVAVMFVLVLLMLTAGCFRPAGSAKAPDVVLIVIDTLRPDHLSTYGYQRETDRALKMLADASLVFENAFAAAPKTIPSIPQTLSSSLFPDAQRATTLMEVARAAGYKESLAVVNNPYVKKWVERIEPTFAQVSAGAFSATEIVDRALEWFARPSNGPRLAYLHFLDAHTPYNVPMPFQSMFVDIDYRGPIGLEFDDVAAATSGRYSDADQQRIVDLYDGTIAYVDDEIGRFIRGLVELELADDALIVVTSDHGEEFWDHGSFFHGQSLYDELLRVPLLVKYPRGAHAGKRVSAPASTLDILPTIAEVISARRDQPSLDDAWQGIPLAEVAKADITGSGRALFATVGRADHRRPPRHSIRTETHKLIVNLVDGTRELYELKTDPLERRSVIAIGERPPAQLLEAYAAATAALAEAGYQLEIRNGTDSKISYDLNLSSEPSAPFVNFHRIELEKTDIAALADNSGGLRWRGRLAAGKSDRVRFDLLAHAGYLNATLTVDGHLAEAGAFRIGAQGVPADANPASIPLRIIDGPPSMASSARTAIRALMPTAEGSERITLSLWRVGDTSAVLPPTLTDEEMERIRALGYME